MAFETAVSVYKSETGIRHERRVDAIAQHLYYMNLDTLIMVNIGNSAKFSNLRHKTSCEQSISIIQSRALLSAI